MLCEDNSAKILGLEAVIVKKVESDEKELHISIELPRCEHRCPVCGELTERVHDYRHQTVRDCKAFGKIVYLHLRKRRYACPACRKRFYEENSFLLLASGRNDHFRINRNRQSGTIKNDQATQIV